MNNLFVLLEPILGLKATFIAVDDSDPESLDVQKPIAGLAGFQVDILGGLDGLEIALHDLLDDTCARVGVSSEHVVAMRRLLRGQEIARGLRVCYNVHWGLGAVVGESVEVRVRQLRLHVFELVNSNCRFASLSILLQLTQVLILTQSDVVPVEVLAAQQTLEQPLRNPFYHLIDAADPHLDRMRRILKSVKARSSKSVVVINDLDLLRLIETHTCAVTRSRCLLTRSPRMESN